MQNFLIIREKISKNPIFIKITFSNIILVLNFMLIPIQKTVFNFIYYILSYSQKYGIKKKKSYSQVKISILDLIWAMDLGFRPNIKKNYHFHFKKLSNPYPQNPKNLGFIPKPQKIGYQTQTQTQILYGFGFHTQILLGFGYGFGFHTHTQTQT